MDPILQKISGFREARGWSEYQLAEKSGIPQSTISSWYRKGANPTIPSLRKICETFDITLSELFAEDNTPVTLTPTQKDLLTRWIRLDQEQQKIILQLLEHM